MCIRDRGNFGKSYSKNMQYAASRYTEAKLAPISAELFRDIDKDLSLIHIFFFVAHRQIENGYRKVKAFFLHGEKKNSTNALLRCV